MTVNITLTDSEGFVWDIASNAQGDPELGIVGGPRDPFDGGMRLRVNGVAVNPLEASLDGREVNTQPIVIDGIVVQRSILVTDATIANRGFARFLDSFTNTSGAEVTITVETITNSGADDQLEFPVTSSLDTVLDNSDVGFVTSDGDTLPGGDSRVMIAYGSDGSQGSFPANVAVSGDTITVTHAITLAAGETRSLLQYATQSETDTQAAGDLTALTQNAFGLQVSGALTGLSREEMLTIANYTDFDLLLDPLELRDSEGNLWTIARNGTISSADGALNDFGLPLLQNIFNDFAGASVNLAENSVTVTTVDFSGVNPATVTYEYTALEDLDVIRLLVTYDNTADGNAAQFNGFSVLATGPNGSQLVGQVNGGFNNQTIGVVIDDSISGSGGTVPAASVVWGAIDANDSFTLLADTLLNNQGNIILGGAGIQTFVYFLAVNDTGIAALADLFRLATPGPELLAYMSAAEVFALRNFDIPEFQGRLQEVLGADGVDDEITGHIWGDSIVSGSGDDIISSLGSDDVVRGGSGEDQIDGGDGSDTLSGGEDDDFVIGGMGSDDINGDAGNDHLFGGGDADGLYGGEGDDTLIGGAGGDFLLAAEDNDVLSGNTGDDTLLGGSGNDTLNGGAGADSMSGENGNDVYFVNSAGDVVVEEFFDELGGTDEVRSSINFTISATQSIEIVTLTGTGNLRADGNAEGNLLVGNSGANRLRGFGGADTLDGGAGGFDTLIGGDGGDVYILGNENDLITETATGTGIDEIRISGSYGLGVAFIEQITLTGTGNTLAVGTAAAERIVGNTGNNALTGLAGADTLEGGDGDDNLSGGTEDDRLFGGVGTDFVFGGQGADTLEGGDGNDNLEGGTEDDRLFGGNDIDELRGGDGADSLDGGDGDDLLAGDDGADTLLGGRGDDLIFGGLDATDVGDELFGGDGNDELQGGAGTDTLTGGDGNDTLLGGAGADTLFGGAGEDFFFGGNAGDTGVNRMSGGANTDTYSVTSANDLVIELENDTGTDAVVSDISYTLTANVEELYLQFTGTNLNGTGNAGDNRLEGNDNDNILNGAAGADTMRGLGGNDTYVVDSRYDVVTEASGTVNGIDTVQTALSYVLDDNVENLLLTGTGSVTGTGNTAANTITGNAAANTLDGGLGNDTLNGDAGNDILLGGESIDSLLGGDNDDQLFGGNGGDGLFGGNGADSLYGGAATDGGTNTLQGGQDGDTYFITSTRDRVTELVGDIGRDTVFSDITYQLTANVEDLTLQGTQNLNGFGNSGANGITGNAGRNILDGGLGADTMKGGGENDIFIVRDAGDVVIENSDGGIDTTRTYITHTLSANVENLTLLSTIGINGTGNDLDNRINGNAQRNVLNGGHGNDTLIGGAGTDRFEFGTALNEATNLDHITDFGAGELIRLNAAIFTSLTAGGLNVTRFVNGTAAVDANDFILYDVATGILRYDADGNGTAAQAIAFADLDNNFALNASFFQIF